MNIFSGSGLKTVVAAAAIASVTLVLSTSTWASPSFKYRLLKSESCTMGVSEFWWLEDPHLPSIPMERCHALVTSTCAKQGGTVSEKAGKPMCNIPAKETQKK